MIYRTVSNSNKVWTLVDNPIECPECHNKTTPNYNFIVFSRIAGPAYVFLTCPNPKCDKSYTAQYEGAGNSINLYFKRIIQGTPKHETFPDEVRNLSSAFVTIYNEAYTAEQLQLLEISGVGYRKALEFLIKDYLVSLFPEKADEIKKMFLGKCISELVIDTKLKESAKRAVWLGNDQTHYIKKWENKDLNDLKKLIRLTVNWVESEILTADLKQSMPE